MKTTAGSCNNKGRSRDELLMRMFNGAITIARAWTRDSQPHTARPTLRTVQSSSHGESGDTPQLCAAVSISGARHRNNTAEPPHTLSHSCRHQSYLQRPVSDAVSDLTPGIRSRVRPKKAGDEGAQNL
ncbi:hypothetical protein J6590_103532 [Homalodisca vitripennis]|nr:hypothetical protein J6590_103532 [Homalodisca vitripennis]